MVQHAQREHHFHAFKQRLIRKIESPSNQHHGTQASSTGYSAPPSNVDSATDTMGGLSLNDEEDLFAHFEAFDSGMAGRFRFYIVFSGRITGIFRNWYI
jgi:hypothetical protein